MRELTEYEIALIVSMIKRGIDVSPFFKECDTKWLYSTYLSSLNSTNRG